MFKKILFSTATISLLLTAVSGVACYSPDGDTSHCYSSDTLTAMKYRCQVDSTQIVKLKPISQGATKEGCANINANIDSAYTPIPNATYVQVYSKPMNLTSQKIEVSKSYGYRTVYLWMDSDQGAHHSDYIKLFCAPLVCDYQPVPATA